MEATETKRNLFGRNNYITVKLGIRLHCRQFTYRPVIAVKLIQLRFIIENVRLPGSNNHMLLFC